MTDDHDAERVLARARRIGLFRTPMYTYCTWLSVAAFVSALAMFVLTVFDDESPPGSVAIGLAAFGTVGVLIDMIVAWFLARWWGLARILKARTRAAEEAADRNDHHAVLAILNPLKRWWGSEEHFLTARSRIALRKAGEL